jgi:hypothetical protein
MAITIISVGWSASSWRTRVGSKRLCPSSSAARIVFACARPLPAQVVSGIQKVHAVVGGFHIVPPLTDEYMQQVIATLKEINPDYLIPGHCAGERFYDLARVEMPDKVIHSAVGARFIFGA